MGNEVGSSDELLAVDGSSDGIAEGSSDGIAEGSSDGFAEGSSDVGLNVKSISRGAVGWPVGGSDSVSKEMDVFIVGSELAVDEKKQIGIA